MTLKATVITVIIAFLLGGVIAYIFIPSKTITVTKRSEEDVKTIKELETKIASLTKIHTVTVHNGATTTTTSDTVISSNTNTFGRVDTTSNTQTNSTSVTEINAKKNFIMPYIKLGQRIDKGGVFIGRDVWNSIGLAIGGDYDWNNTKKVEIFLGATVRF